jgi:hexosaminidase
MPAHAASWLAAYPELLCTSHSKFPAPDVGKRADDTKRVVWSAYRELCLGNEATYEMAEKILAELTNLFPGPYIHVGGDEASKFGWKHCDLCQAKMKAENLKDERELQSYFIKRVGKIIESRGRKFVGWDEIMEGGLAPNAIVMSWRGVAPGQAAVKAGHTVVFSPTSHCYFDYTYEKISTAKVYSFEPLESLSPEAAGRVKGVQGNLWSEWIADLNRLEYMAFPRACALAEVAWSPRESRDWQDFQKRMATHRLRLEALRVNFCREAAPSSPARKN